MRVKWYILIAIIEIVVFVALSYFLIGLSFLGGFSAHGSLDWKLKVILIVNSLLFLAYYKKSINLVRENKVGKALQMTIFSVPVYFMGAFFAGLVLELFCV